MIRPPLEPTDAPPSREPNYRWRAYDAKVASMSCDEVRHTLKAEARLRAREIEDAAKDAFGQAMGR